ncbi:MAG: DNA polymerase III subunit alpha [Bacteroidota bacterium]|jgi:DNA polymerase-3 subunit alpha
MFLIFDTETTGLPRDYNAPITDLDNWPRCVQIAWQLHDETGKLISHNNLIIKPEGFTIPFKAVEVHGISTERALEEGIHLTEAFTSFIEALDQCDFVCGHNIEFDINIVSCEFIRIGIENKFQGKSVLDTKSDETTEFCAIPGGKGGKFKWPTLSELHHKLFSEAFEEAHNAAFDVAATARCFFEVIRLGIIRVKGFTSQHKDSIHYIAPDLSELLEQERSRKKQISSKGSDSLKDKQQTSSSFSDVKFTHLHNHTQFSVLQCTSDVDDLVKKAAEYNCPAVSITDHGNMYGAFLFWQAVDKHNKKLLSKAVENQKPDLLKCIIGCELYVTKDRFKKDRQDNGFSQVLLAKNKKGYQNLTKLSSAGYVEGYYYVPRIDREILLQYKDGLIATTGSLQGEIPNLILNVGETQAEEAFVWWKENFGDDFYVELNRHQLPEEEHVNQILLGFAKKYDVKYFAANNNYYLDKKGAKAHDALLCIKDGELVETPIGRGRGFRFGFPNDEFYFKSPEEMKNSFQDLPEAIEETNRIAEKIESYKLEREVLLPKFQIAEEFISDHQEEINQSLDRLCSFKEKFWKEKNFSDEQIEQQKKELLPIAEQYIYLVSLTYQGASKRYNEISPEIKERIDFELSTIEKMGYPGYFLIVSDFTTEARKMKVSVGPGRGSAAGSVIAYCLGITNVDPIKYGLLFERFLNPDRISMPDIDIDFDDEGRDKVIKYVIDKYGSNQVAQIVTYGTMGGKSAIRDSGRVLNLPLPDTDRLAKTFPDHLAATLKGVLAKDGIDPKLKDAFRNDHIQQAEAFRKIAAGNDLQATTVKQASELEGCVRNTGIHACGVIITPDDITNFVPVAKPKDNDLLVTQFDNSVAESAGLLKMDFLGLKTLTIIKDALRLIQQRHGIEIDIDAISFEDQATYELFSRGETNGLFQFESDGMQKYLKDLKPDKFTDLIAMNALYRPGPLAYIPNYVRRKHGHEKVVYELEGMEEFLSETYGITVYQEQVMLLSQKLANFTKGDADVLRKAMGKKQKDVLDKMKAKFLEGCAQNGHDTKVCEKVWGDWESFASYAFNKSHSTCYAYLAFQTGYLKAHYPAEFMASVLTHNMSSVETVSFFMDECRRMGLKVLGPDINESISTFSVNKNGEIRFGMAAIKGVGEKAVENIVEERKSGPYKSVFDIAKRCDLKNLNKRVIEGLASAGAFDNLPEVHRAMFLIPDADGTTLCDRISKFGSSVQTGNESSQASLFGDAEEMEIKEPALPKVEPFGKLDQLRREKEVVGVYISGHPLDSWRLEINHIKPRSLSDLKADIKKFTGVDFSVAGIITSVQHRVSKAGKPFGNFVIEDYQGSYEFVLFGEDYIKYKNYLENEMALHVRARVQERYNQPGNLEVKISKMQLLSDIKDREFKSIKIKIGVNDLNADLLEQVDALIKNHSNGKCNLEVTVDDPSENMSVKLFSKTIKVNLDSDFLDELTRMKNVEFELG